MIIYLNGQYIEEKEAALSPFDHGYLYGIGAFETFRLYNGRPFLPDAHVARLNRALRDLQIAYEVNKQELLDMLASLLLLNDIKDGSARVRLNVSAGVSDKGFTAQTYDKPTVLCFVSRLNPEALPLEKEGKLLSVRRNTPEGSFRLKSHHYLNNMYAKQEIGNDPNLEGIFLTREGDVAEGIVSNVFWRKGDKVFTPSLGTGILDGVTRQFVIDELKRQGTEVAEGRFRFQSMLEADEAWMTNSVLEIIPFSKIEEVPLPGVSGKTVQLLRKQYQQEINKMNVKEEEQNGAAND
ncbi:aminodeoxychorismate lyase [Bacillus siamensis]|uniref:aminodeoxychorismate lyase n=1 Tax=Bacillus siamensis TaxID=659243 RepID=UPI002230D908|nr:aminodeoxychorismate lyase [Bacillus siamensis]UZD74260.1 aminodeoxychorismate lyase [Bacillus siamensis]